MPSHTNQDGELVITHRGIKMMTISTFEHCPDYPEIYVYVSRERTLSAITDNEKVELMKGELVKMLEII